MFSKSKAHSLSCGHARQVFPVLCRQLGARCKGEQSRLKAQPDGSPSIQVLTLCVRCPQRFHFLSLAGQPLISACRFHRTTSSVQNETKGEQAVLYRTIHSSVYVFILIINISKIPALASRPLTCLLSPKPRRLC